MSLPWRELRETILGLPAETPEAKIGLDLLANWDGIVSTDSAAAAVFELFIAEIWHRVARMRAPASAEWALGRGFTPLLGLTLFAAGRASCVLRLMREQPEGWFEAGWPEEMMYALGSVVARLREQYGPSTAGWAWGSIRPLQIWHPIGRVAQLRWLFNRGPFPFGGDGNTVSQAGSTPLRPGGNPTAIASLRMVVDVGEWEASRFVLPGGQSGNPLSPHYDDLLPLWRRGEGVPIAWSPQAIDEATRSTLELLPLA
jgi:penicillin amidase